jgi:DNA polymerase-3 subunit alpha
VVIIGEVAVLSYLFTRDRKPFVIATLEDISGSIEVMVWPKSYADTRELWQEGNILLVEGKVRVKDDRVQLTCESADSYQAQTAPTEQPVSAQPETAASTPVPAVLPRRRLMVSIGQTSDENSDIAHLHRLMGILREFPGGDEVNLCVTNGERVTNLRLSGIYTNYCPELHQRLVELVGEDGLKVEMPNLS